MRWVELQEYGLTWWAKVWGGSTSGIRQVAREAILANLKDLPKALQELALIVCFAEVGRGYASSIKSELMPWLADIAAGKSKWADVKDRWAPSLTYAEDLKEELTEE